MARRRTDQTRQEFFDSRTSSHDDGQTKRNIYVARIRATTNRPKIIRVFHDWCDFFREGRIYGIFSFPNRRRQISRSSNLAIVKSHYCIVKSRNPGVSGSKNFHIDISRGLGISWCQEFWFWNLLIPRQKPTPRCLYRKQCMQSTSRLISKEFSYSEKHLIAFQAQKCLRKNTNSLTIGKAQINWSKSRHSHYDKSDCWPAQWAERRYGTVPFNSPVMQQPQLVLL